MNCIFNTETAHRIKAADYNHYIVPSKHPSRILEEHDFIYVINGTWEIGVGDRIFTVQNDTVLILPANVYHFGVKECTADTKTFFIHASVVAGDGYSNTAVVKYDPYRICLPLCHQVSEYPNVKKLFSRIIEERLLGNENLASAYFTLLLCELNKVVEKRSTEPTASKIRQLIHQHLESNLTNKELADMLYIGVRSAERIFKATYNMTIHQYYLCQKLEKAAFYLEYVPNMSIKEISALFSFYDEYHFSKQFKRHFGVSPQQYRTHLNKQEQLNCV